MIRNRAGVTLPFSVETLATSLRVAGVDAPTAFRLAGQLVDGLHQRHEHELSSGDLAELAAAVLEAEVGASGAERFRAWRRFRHSGRPLVLCLMGAPGVGKSTVATRLAEPLGVRRVIPTDGLREVLRTTIPESALPELHLPAHATLGRDRAGAAQGFHRQASAVCGAAAAVAGRMVDERRSVILVGSHLVPGGVRAALAARGSDALVLELLLTLQDESLHRGLMMRRMRSDPAGSGAGHVIRFDAVRSLQAELIDMARAAGVTWQDLVGPERVIEWIVDHVVAETEAVAIRS
ncbi:MAG: hypothetical protein ACE37K_10420 [Planctomycetota bacterium]